MTYFGPRYISQGHSDKPGRVVIDQETGEQIGPVYLDPGAAMARAAHLTRKATVCATQGHDFVTESLDDDNVAWTCRHCGYAAVETHSEGGL